MTATTKLTLQRKKEQKQKITMLTAYDAALASLIDAAGIDVVLVGDSLGNTALGHANTLSVTMEDMLHHTKAVVRGVKNAMVVADMPFMSYQVSVEEAVRNAGRFIKEAGAAAVKMEGAGPVVSEAIRQCVSIGIPVVGHLGFTPQSVNQIGGYKVQGKEQSTAERLMAEAQVVQDAGAFAIVIEMVPGALGKKITEQLSIPIISCGAGPDCDGQVIVINDLLGLSERAPKFTKQYLDLRKEISGAVNRYKNEVEQGKFPGPEQTF